MLEWAQFVWGVWSGGVQEVVQVPLVPRGRGRAEAAGRAVAVGVGFCTAVCMFEALVRNVTLLVLECIVCAGAERCRKLHKCPLCREAVGVQQQRSCRCGRCRLCKNFDLLGIF